MKAAEFMRGRYGHDRLNTVIWIIVASLYLLNFIMSMINPFRGYPIIVILILAFAALAVFRSLSTNITKRMYENNKFISIYRAVGDFFKTLYMKIRDRKTHRYVRCPYCKAQLRLKKRTGKQEIHCPRCNKDFSKTIRF